MSDEIWAVTSYFNPMRWQRRRANYRAFRQHLPFPLVAVELGYEGRFDLAASDADILLHVNGGDVMWQKERLLNMALRALPDSCGSVVWMDCDVVFQRTDMPDQIAGQLERAPLVQLFSLVHDLAPDAEVNQWRTRAAEPRHSIPQRIAAGMTAAECLGKRHPDPLGVRSPGHAWAMRREVIDSHGFYDCNIVGGGDEAIACAAYGVFDEVIRLESMNPRQVERYLAWGEPFYQSVRGNVSMVEGDLVHLWHGAPTNRQWFQRHSGLARHEFDPFVDIAVSDSGCWRWNTPKPELHRYVRDYLAARAEDGPNEAAA